ncbi:hypothetical protein ACVW1A_002720 [Bradyrhizobium sp. LB1.3]
MAIAAAQAGLVIPTAGNPSDPWISIGVRIKPIAVDNASASSGVSASPTPRIIAVISRKTKPNGMVNSMTRAYALAWSRMSAGVASIIINCRLKIPPISAIEIDSNRPTASVVPTTILIRPCSPAPWAWPIRTVAPVLSPMTKPNRKNITGKNTDTDASASTPIIWPI